MAIKKHPIGVTLAKIRQNMGLSQEYVADQLGYDQSYVSKSETGNRQISAEEFAKWCSVLNLDDRSVIRILKGETYE